MKNNENQTPMSEADSLSNYLSKANDFNSTPAKRKEYIQKAYDIIINQPNDSMNRVNLFKIANRYYNINNLNAYKETALVVLEKSQSSKDTLSTAKAYSYLGDYFGSQSVSDSAFLYYFKAEKIYLQRNENLNLAKARLNKAQLQFNESDFLGSEISVFKALRVLKGEKANDVVYECNNLLGLVYNELGEFDKAIEFHQKALNSIDNKTMPIEFQSRATSLNNLGLVYQNLNKNKQASLYFEEGLQKENDLILYKPSLYAMLLDNLGYARFKANETKDIPQLFYKSLQLRDSLQLTIGVIISNIHLSEYYASKGDRAKAVQYAKEALAIARKAKNARNLLFPLKQLAIIEPLKATIYNKEYIHINDSLQKEERKMGDKFTRIEYETDEIKQVNTDLTLQNRNLVYLFGSLVLIAVFLYVIKAQKVKNRELLYKQEQQKANEEIYNLMIAQQNSVDNIRVIEKQRIAQDLHDGVLGRMFGVRMNLESLYISSDEDESHQIVSYLSELKNIEQDIREISHDLSREKSELINNFVAIVDNLLEDQKKSFSSNLDSFIDSTIKWDLIGNTCKINLYRVVQESLQNSNKYAKANNIRVVFKNSVDHLVLHISDDGLGFNIDKTKKGIGLKNILSRITECQGTLDIQSKTGEGTTITVTIPI
jgi:signal transduction histidine kinase